MAVDGITGVTGMPGDVVADLPGQRTTTDVPIALPILKESKIPTQQQLSAPELNKEDLEKLTDNLNQLLASFDVSARFSVHEVTKDIMVRIYNSKTNETIREIPQRKILDMVSRMMELVGLLVDDRA